MPAACRSPAQLRVEPCGLSREVVAFGEAGRRSGSFGVKPCCGHWVTVTLVEVRRDGVVAGEGGIEFRQGGQAGSRAVALADQTGVPPAAVLLGKWHEPAVGTDPCRAPCVVEQHEREQARDFLMLDL